MKQYILKDLSHLHAKLELAYAQYKNCAISEKEYLASIKPIDQAIDNIEISTLQDTLALREPSSQLSQ